MGRLLEVAATVYFCSLVSLIAAGALIGIIAMGWLVVMAIGGCK